MAKNTGKGSRAAAEQNRRQDHEAAERRNLAERLHQFAESQRMDFNAPDSAAMLDRAADALLADERATRPDRDAVPIIDSESWGWGHCIACGGGAVTHRGLMLLSVPDTPTLARIAWCEAEECIEDRKLTVAFPVTPRHVEWIDSVLALEPEAREETGPALRIDDDGAHIYWADPLEGCWVAFKRVDCVGEEELPERRLPAPEAREIPDAEVAAAYSAFVQASFGFPGAPAMRAALEAAREVSRG